MSLNPFITQQNPINSLGFSPVTEYNPYHDPLREILGQPSASQEASAMASGISTDTPPESSWGSFVKAMVGGKDKYGNTQNGWGGLALGGLQTGASLFTGLKQYGIAQDSLKEQKRQYNQNYEAQRKTLNTQMADRQAARVASNPSAYESVGSYMNRNGI